VGARRRGDAGREAGQSTVEWIGLLLVVTALLVGVLAAAGSGRLGATLAESIAMRLLCAVGMSSTCAESGDLVAAYGPEVAGEVERNAPQIVYERGMGALPVDFRSCRNQHCGSGPATGAVWRSDTGEPAVAFVHVVDCRTELARAQSASHGYHCGAERDGNLYLQFWTYYGDSSSLKLLQPVVDGPPLNQHAYHADDWEGYQVRIGPDGVEARASSHHGYNHAGGPRSWLSDAGIVQRSAWGPSTGRLYVSGGSHAGHVYENRRLSIRRLAKAGADLGLDGYALASSKRPPAKLPRHLMLPPPRTRWTPASHLTLIPIETLDAGALATRFAIPPPWEKDVYRDPESEDT
jgi:hypothetical protein